jgi:hypothetical protein
MIGNIPEKIKNKLAKNMHKLWHRCSAHRENIDSAFSLFSS